MQGTIDQRVSVYQHTWIWLVVRVILNHLTAKNSPIDFLLMNKAEFLSTHLVPGMTGVQHPMGYKAGTQAVNHLYQSFTSE